MGYGGVEEFEPGKPGGIPLSLREFMRLPRIGDWRRAVFNSPIMKKIISGDAESTPYVAAAAMAERHANQQRAESDLKSLLARQVVEVKEVVESKTNEVTPMLALDELEEGAVLYLTKHPSENEKELQDAIERHPTSRFKDQ